MWWHVYVPWHRGGAPSRSFVIRHRGGEHLHRIIQGLLRELIDLTPPGFAQREMKLLQSIFSREGLSHHMEDKYYQGMGMCAGFAAFAGSELVTLEEYKMMEYRSPGTKTHINHYLSCRRFGEEPPC
jgi:hypothetical protein